MFKKVYMFGTVVTRIKGDFKKGVYQPKSKVVLSYMEVV